MTEIVVSIIVKGDKKKVYELLKQMDQFPRFIKNIQEVNLIGSSENKIVTGWKIDMEGADVIWEEEDVFNDNDMSIEFKMLRGDYQDYFGKWELKELDSNNTQITISANFDWGMPNFEKFVGSVLKRKAKGALIGMLKAIKKQLESKKD